MKDHVTTVRVRYGETDKMGVVYHANYLVYFEEGRTELMRVAGLAYSELEAQGYRLVVTQAGVRYLAAAMYDETLSIHTRVGHVGRVRLRFDYRILRDGDTVAEGFTELACLDVRNRPARIPENVSGRLRDWVP